MNQANGELLAVKEVPLDHTSPTILQDLQTEVAILRCVAPGLGRAQQRGSKHNMVTCEMQLSC